MKQMRYCSRKILLLIFVFFSLLMVNSLMLTRAETIDLYDSESEVPSEGSFDVITDFEYTIPISSFTTTQIVNAPRPPFGQYRWHYEDFGWIHTFDTTYKEIMSVDLDIRAWDVDSPIPYVDPYYWERDKVYADGSYLGELTGGSDIWSVTSLNVPAGLLEDGEIIIWLDIDANGPGTRPPGSWAVTIDWSKLQVEWDWARIIDKTLNLAEGELGDVVHVSILVSIPSDETTTVIDELPEGFGYIKGSFLIDGVPAIPSVKKGILTYDITEGGVHILEFDVKIDHAKNWEDWEVCNLATATWYSNGDPMYEMEDSECFIINPFEDLQKYVGLPKADVVFSFDLTGSMGGAIGQAKTQATTIINNLQSLIGDLAFGVVTHVDYPHTYYNYYGYSATYGSSLSGDYAYKTDLDITEDAAAAISTITSLSLHYGGDGPQDYSRVLYESQFLSWREDSTKILILFGDNIPHDDDFWYSSTGGDPGPDELKYTLDDIDFQTVVAAVASQEITILAVDCSGGYYASFYQYMADNTGGQYFMLGATGVAEVIYEMVKAEASETLIILTETESQWALVMEITNPFSYTMTDTIITDRFGAEIEIDEPFPSSCTHGTLSYDTKGKSEKVFLTWEIGDLLPGETARLIILVSTDLNPAGHQEYTTSDVYELNSGATLKFIDPEQDMQLSAVTDKIYVEVYDVIIC